MTDGRNTTRDAVIDLAGALANIAAALHAHGDAEQHLIAAIRQIQLGDAAGPEESLRLAIEMATSSDNYGRVAYDETLAVLDRLGGANG